MMDRLKNIMLAAIVLLILGSCNDFEMLQRRSGYLSVSLQRDDEVHTKAVDAKSVDQTFALTISDENGKVVAEVPDHRTLEIEPLSLVAGMYDIKAESGADLNAAWDSPFYSGTATAKVIADKNNNAEIVCSLANVMVTVDFSDEFDENFVEYSLTVENGIEALVFSNLTGTLDKTAYFKVTGDLYWRLTLVNIDGALFEKEGYYTDVEAQQHYAMSFSLKDDTVQESNGAMGVKVVVDDSVNPSVEYPVVLNFGVSNYPSVAPNEGFDISGATAFPVGDTSDKRIVATATSGFSSLLIRQGVEGQYDLWYQLVEATPESISELASLGISASSLAYGATTTEIDFTEYISKLPIGSYLLEVLVYDIKGLSTRADIYLNIISAIDADVVSAEPGTTTAVITAKWYNDPQPAGLGLEYKKTGASEWIKVNTDDITFDAATKTFHTQITGLSEATEYEFRPYSDKDTDLRSMTFTTLSGLRTLDAVPWARFAVVTGGWEGERPQGLGFEYRQDGASQWQTADESTIIYDDASGTFEGEIRGLEPETRYEFRAVSASSDKDAVASVSFTTESAGSIYNMNFDDWYKDGKVWYPFAEGGSHTWDSANEGAATFIGSSTTPVEGADAVSGKAARLESKYAVIAFAAGNLYTGDFGKISGVGAQLDWGVPFGSRPLALKGHYKYTSKKIDKTGSGMGSYKGTQDRAQILVFITDWTAPFSVNTTSGTFVDFDADYIIAYGKLESDQSYSDYVEFTIPLEYRSLTKQPTYVVISAAASYLGDYFTGGVGSTLYVDEFSFVYDPAELTEEEREKVKYR